MNVNFFCASLLFLSTDPPHTLSHVGSQLYSGFTIHSLRPIEISKNSFCLNFMYVSKENVVFRIFVIPNTCFCVSQHA